MTTSAPKLSVIVNNYNYADYVSVAIESALAQDPQPEVIIIDDCSTDNSAEIISQYGDRAKLVLLEENVGQGGAFNHSAPHATGDVVLFLDADDFMLEGAARTILDNYDPDVAIYHYRMRYADEESQLSGIYPPMELALAEGDISEKLRTIGSYAGTVTSGMVISKKVLDQILPMPNPDGFRYGGDGYLTGAAPLYGPNKSVDETITAYRLHGRQHSRFASALAKRARFRIEHAHERYATTIDHAARLDLEIVDNLGEHDASITLERIVSLLLDPEQHPVSGDTISALSKKYLSDAPVEGSLPKRLFWSIWWTVFTHSPSSVQRTLIKWRVDAATRPAWFQATGHFIRRRLLAKSG